MNFADGNDYIDIIVYIVIVVAGLIASAYRNYSKKKEIEGRPHDHGIPGFPEIEFEPVFEEPLEEEPIIIDTISPIPEEVKEPEVVSVLDTPDSIEDVVGTDSLKISDMPEKEGQAMFTETTRHIISATLDEIEQADSQLFQSSISDDEIGKSVEEVSELEFNLKEAVIYSELLQAKYFNNSY